MNRYIIPCYEVLHSQSREYIVEDIISLMEERGAYMMLYHGSYMEIREPDIMHSRRNLDFGCGFYTTPLYLQTQKWCERFIRRGKEGVISCYRLDEIALERCRILKFDAYSGEWLDFKQYINRDAALDRLRYEKPNR